MRAFRSIVLALILAAAALPLVLTPSAEAACTQVQKLLGCVDPQPGVEPAIVFDQNADAGGNENLDQPLPSGKHFGWNTFLKEAGDTSYDKVYDNVYASGADYIRSGSGWRWTQTTKTSPPIPQNWDLGPVWQRYIDHGIRPIQILAYAPVWASRFATCETDVVRSLSTECVAVKNASNPNLAPDAAHYPDFVKFGKAMHEKYPSMVLETMNEPDYVWLANLAWKISPQEAAQMQCAFYRGVKATYPDAFILSPGMYDLNYIREFMRAGGVGCYDALSFHDYPSHSADIYEAGKGKPFSMAIDNVRRFQSYFHDHAPIWMTETGYQSVYTPVPGITEAKTTEYSKKLFNRLTSMNDVPVFLFHTTRDAPLSTSQTAADKEYGWGWSRADWSPRPQFCWLVQKAGRVPSYPGC